LWQIQELESIAAQYFVLLAKAEKGMGLEAGNKLIKEELGNTFGKTIHKLANEGLLSPKLESRLKNLLKERNWLVHKSRASSRNVIYHDDPMHKLIKRLNEISEESLSLLKEVGALCEEHVKKHGISEQYINETAMQLLEQWSSE